MFYYFADENTVLITGMKCSCPGDNDDKTCACCSKNACQCGQQNPYNCVPCDSLDRCAETIKGNLNMMMIIA